MVLGVVSSGWCVAEDSMEDTCILEDADERLNKAP